MRILIVIAAAGMPLMATHSLAKSPDTPPEIAACIVDNDMRDVRTLLNTLPGSPEERRVGAKIMVFYGGCDDNKVVAGQIAWRERAEIAGAALLSKLDRVKFDAASPPPRDRWAFVLGSGKIAGADYDAGAVSMRQFGDCVVTVAPAAALQLARSPRGSSEEAAAITALSPTLSDCIAPGQNLKLKRADLRLVVAEPLYHMISK